MADYDMGADLFTLTDEEGVEQTFELMDTYEDKDGNVYYALVPYYEKPILSWLYSRVRTTATKKLLPPSTMMTSTRESARSSWTDFPRCSTTKRNNFPYFVHHHGTYANLQNLSVKIDRYLY